MSQPNASLLGAHRSGNVQRVLLSSAAPAPGHLLQRLKKVNKLAVRKRPEDPGVMGTDKTSAIRHKAVHRLADAWMKMPAGINAIIFSKTSNVSDLWYIRSHKPSRNYTSNQGAI